MKFIASFFLVLAFQPAFALESKPIWKAQCSTPTQKNPLILEQIDSFLFRVHPTDIDLGELHYYRVVSSAQEKGYTSNYRTSDEDAVLAFIADLSSPLLAAPRENFTITRKDPHIEAKFSLIRSNLNGPITLKMTTVTTPALDPSFQPQTPAEPQKTTEEVFTCTEVSI